MLSNIVKNILIKISRIIYWVIPKELKLKNQDSLAYIHEKQMRLECYNHFKPYYQKSMLFRKELDIREYAIKEALSNDPEKKYYYLEFGVFQGISTNLFSKYIKKLYAFDSFEGLHENWTGTYKVKSTFTTFKQRPRLNKNIELVIGFIQNTLKNFVREHQPKVNFVHLDMDTYESTIFALNILKPYLIKGAIIIFDELHNFQGWKQGEYKALIESFKKSEYDFIAFNLEESQAVIKIK